MGLVLIVSCTGLFMMLSQFVSEQKHAAGLNEKLATSADSMASGYSDASSQKAEAIDPQPPSQRAGALKAPSHTAAKARLPSVGESAIATPPQLSQREDVPPQGEEPATTTVDVAPSTPGESEVASSSQETVPAEKEGLTNASLEPPLVSGRQRELARPAPEQKLRKARRGETSRPRKRRAGGLLGKLWR